MRTILLAAVLVVGTPSIGNAAGFVHNANFLVFTESSVSPRVSRDFAGSIMAQAERYRRQIAEDWLGRPLPHGIGRATINLKFSDIEDSGLTWAIDHPSRKMHTVYLVTSADKALGATLAHEMVHVVLATRFPYPNRLPAWLEEGIAAHYDNDQRRQVRADAMQWWIETANWPRVAPVVEAHNIASDDQAAYTVAVSLTEMLLAKGDRKKLLEFGQTAARSGTVAALKQHYGIADVDQLQQTWQQWLTQRAVPGNPLSSGVRLSQSLHQPQSLLR